MQERPSRNLITLNADLPYCLSMVLLRIPAVTIPIGSQIVYSEALWYTFRHPDDFPRLFRPEDIYVPRSMQLVYIGFYQPICTGTATVTLDALIHCCST